MLICVHWFHIVLNQQSSCRKRKSLKKSKLSKSYSQNNVYVRIAYNSFFFFFFVCVCVCVCVIQDPRDGFEVIS